MTFKCAVFSLDFKICLSGVCVCYHLFSRNILFIWIKTSHIVEMEVFSLENDGNDLFLTQEPSKKVYKFV